MSGLSKQISEKDKLLVLENCPASDWHGLFEVSFKFRQVSGQALSTFLISSVRVKAMFLPLFKFKATTSLISSGKSEWTLVGCPTLMASLTNFSGLLWMPMEIELDLSSVLAEYPRTWVLRRLEFMGKGASMGWFWTLSNSETIDGKPRRGWMSVEALMVWSEASCKAKTGGLQSYPSVWSWLHKFGCNGFAQLPWIGCFFLLLTTYHRECGPTDRVGDHLGKNILVFGKVGMLWTSLVSLRRELPYRQWWKSTWSKGKVLSSLTKGVVCHMKERPGFSTEKYFCQFQTQLD